MKYLSSPFPHSPSSKNPNSQFHFLKFNTLFKSCIESRVPGNRFRTHNVISISRVSGDRFRTHSVISMEGFTIPMLESNLVGFTMMFFCVYLFGYFILFKNWNAKRSDASSCLMSLVHGTPAVFLAIKSMDSPILKGKMVFSSPNTQFQEMVLEFSIAYFLMDSLHYLLFYPRDVLFLAHHIATLYVFLTCRFAVRHGGTALLGLLILAEVTSPCQNTWSLARYRKVDLPEAARLHAFLSPIFYSFYSLVRGVLGPWFVYKMGKAFIFEDANGVNIPIAIRVSWMVVIVSAIMISILWILNLWIALYKEIKRKELKKFS